MNSFEELLLDSQPVKSDAEAMQRQRDCNALQRKFRKEISAMLAYGGAEVFAGLYTMLHQGGMNPIEAWCYIFTHALLIFGTIRNSRNALHTGGRIDTILKKINDYHASIRETSDVLPD